MSATLTLILLLLVVVLQIFLLWRTRNAANASQGTGEIQPLLQLLLQQQQQQLIHQLQGVHTEAERQLRNQLEHSALTTRQELGGNFSRFQQDLGSQVKALSSLQQQQLEQFARQLQALKDGNEQQLQQIRDGMQAAGKSGREEQAAALQRFADSLSQALQTNLRNLAEGNNQRLSEVRATLETRLRDLQTENAQRLEEMRKTVDEKLHATLEQRLGESFKQVSERLEKVHQGLGEMQQLAMGVGDLKRVLSNVKTRGNWGEMQLAALLEQTLTPEQYAANVETIPGSNARVEFALRLPGQSPDQPVWLPIDAKFPKEQYERLLDAADRADLEGQMQAGRELERALRLEAKTIAEKYLSPPLTTDFAILFLPTEGLYAEVMRRPGLADELQRTRRVSLAGPSTLSALLNSLQMGFRTLALEKRSSEVWQVLGAVKTEFDKFGEVLAATHSALERAAKNIEKAQTRSRVMSKKLKDVEALPEDSTQRLLGQVMEEELPEEGEIG